MGIRFDPWQQGLIRALLGKRADGRYASTVGGVTVSIPRQVGKTFTIGAVAFALCILFPGLTVIWTAHRLKTAGETFRSMQAMAKRRRIAPFIEQVFTGSGDEEIRFRNGSRILFGARERGFGRGFAQVDVIVFDEAQILTDKALDDMVPAANQSKHPAGALLFFMGTPPKPTDPGEAFTAKRRKALAGESPDGLYVEFSADPDAKPDDRKQWAKANPSYPKRTPVESMMRMRENLASDEAFLREGLGVWDEEASSLALPKWDARKVPGLALTGKPVAVGLAASVDHAWASIAASCGTADAMAVGAVDRRPGTAWLVAEAKRIQTAHGCAVVVDKRGPLADLIPSLVEAGVFLTLVDTSEFCDACAQLARAVDEGTMQHPGHPELDAAVHGASWRPIGDRRAFARKTSEISMLEAATLAAFGIPANYDVLMSAF